MTEFKPPSKEEVKKKYNISEDDFEVLTQDTTPEPSILQKLGQHLEVVAQLFGVPTFLLKTKTGRVVAVIFIYLWLPAVSQKFQDAKIVARNYYEAGANTIETLAEQKWRYAIVIPDSIKLSDYPIDLGTGNFPPGSGIYPVG